MRVAVFVALALVSACATDKLGLVPPAGVDLSGHWLLNVEESDDPLHLIQSQNVDPSKATPGSQGQGGQGGRGGRSGRGGAMPGNFPAPAIPPIGTLSEGLRWPGSSFCFMTSSSTATRWEPTSFTSSSLHPESSRSRASPTR